MGKRSRRRSAAEAGAPSRAERDAARRRRAEATASGRPTPQRSRRGGERPAPPWGSFPLTELVILLGMALAIGGFIAGVEERRGQTMFAAGVVLGALGGLELAVRDHFAGYRSHTTLLSGVAAFATITAVVLAVSELAPSVPAGAVLSAALVTGALVFTLSFRQLRRVFQARSGGLSFR